MVVQCTKGMWQEIRKKRTRKMVGVALTTEWGEERMERKGVGETSRRRRCLDFEHGSLRKWHCVGTTICSLFIFQREETRCDGAHKTVTLIF